jgi:beta-aspartyl-peptidase (threonine type)
MRIVAALLGILSLACFASGSAQAGTGGAGFTYFAIGHVQAPRPARTEEGLLLSGGGEWVPAAFRWFGGKAGHGHIVIISAYGGGEDGQQFFRTIGGVESVETLVFSDRKASFDPQVLSVLRHADGIFIAGGDQSKYVRFWKGTPVARLLDRHIRSGKPVGGTSAGLAILGFAGYGAMDGGSIDSATALHDPDGPAVTMVGDFLHMPFLEHVVTDTHFTARNRLGRLIAFVALERTTADPRAVGLGVDQGSALCVDSRGVGRLFTIGGGYAWLVQPESTPRIMPGQPLEFPLVRLTGIGPASTIEFKAMRVANPAFVRAVSVRDGALVGVARQ